MIEGIIGTIVGGIFGLLAKPFQEMVSQELNKKLYQTRKKEKLIEDSFYLSEQLMDLVDELGGIITGFWLQRNDQDISKLSLSRNFNYDNMNKLLYIMIYELQAPNDIPDRMRKLKDNAHSAMKDILEGIMHGKRI